MEYPGYGKREGKPSRDSFDTAALAAYATAARAGFRASRYAWPPSRSAAVLRHRWRAASQPPDKLVFIVPFDDLKSVAQDHMPYAPMSLLLRGQLEQC